MANKLMTVGKNKKQITLIFALIVLIVATSFATYLLIVKSRPASQAKNVPAIKIGNTTLSKKDYDTIIRDASEQQVSEKSASVDTENYIRYKEVARLTNTVVPDYLVAAQAQVEYGSYIRYSDLSAYDIAVFYPKALFVLTALTQAGGSLASVFHAPYDTKNDGEKNRTTAQDLISKVKDYTGRSVLDENKNRITDDPLRYELAYLGSLDALHPAGIPNYTGVVALTDAGTAITSTDAGYVEIDKLPVKTTAYPAEIVRLIEAVKEGSLSDPVQLSNPNAYIVVHKDKVIKKDDNALSRLQSELQRLGN